MLRDLNEARKSVAYGDDWLPSFLERAEADKNVIAVIVIGSAIRPDVTSDDLDVMVLCRDVAGLREKAPIEIDLRKADLDCVEDKIRAGHDLLIWAIRFGLPVLDKDGAWAGLRDPLILPYRSIRESCWTEMSRTWKCECFELELWLYASA